MALITTFKPLGADANVHVHRTAVECGWAIFSRGSRTFIQLSTYGSEARANPGRVSQTIQVDENGARELKRLIDRAFSLLSA